MVPSTNRPGLHPFKVAMLGSNPAGITNQNMYPGEEEMRMRVRVMGRKEAFTYSCLPHDNQTVMISVSDPRMVYDYTPFMSDTNGIRAILSLCFADADEPGPDVYGFDTDESEMMSFEDAEKIVQLLKENNGTDIIVHCDAGISRSSGIAAAILKYFTGSDEQIFRDTYYCPNTWCYRKTLGALQQSNLKKHSGLV